MVCSWRFWLLTVVSARGDGWPGKHCQDHVGQEDCMSEASPLQKAVHSFDGHHVEQTQQEPIWEPRTSHEMPKAVLRFDSSRAVHVVSRTAVHTVRGS